MKIIGGKEKGRRLNLLKSPFLRPTSGKVREAIFNVLGQSLESKRILDLFAGTGAMGIEALSRGARCAVFVDKSERARGLIKKNISLCGFASSGKVLRKDAADAVRHLIKKGERFDIVFMDAPYVDISLTLEALNGMPGLLCEGGIVVCEVSKRSPLPGLPEGLALLKEKRYGDTLVYFLGAGTFL